MRLIFRPILDMHPTIYFFNHIFKRIRTDLSEFSFVDVVRKFRRKILEA